LHKYHSNGGRTIINSNENNKIKKLTEFIPGFKNRIEKIPLKNIESNPYNPRKRFGQEEEDELVESINSKGVLQPIIVFEKKGLKGRFILLDGQRRFQACKKLGIEIIPAHIIDKEPTPLENLSLMFHIHNVYEEWTDMAIVTTLVTILKELKIDKEKPSREDITNIKRITSLSEYKIRKYIDVLRFSKPVLDKFLDAELRERPDLDIDILSELRKPMKKINKVIPSLAKKYSEEDVVNVFIQKKKDKIITANKQIRMLSKIINNAEKGKINKKLAADKIAEFFDNKEVTMEKIYSETSEAVEQAKTIIKNSEKLRIEIDNIDLRKVPKDDKKNLMKELTRLEESIQRKKEIGLNE